ncbi:uncharacterized protein LOC134231113 [Saccostrea cucullata]|uniref:uncharacterized protein LOC134231113 n=1 Tax=Saccostrea cuccullata TaxID=36930 RepID=UPI002ECFDA96
MASVVVIGGVLGGLTGLCVIITGFLLVYCLYLKRKMPKNIDEDTKNPECDYFEAIDFKRIRENRSQEQRNHINPPNSSLLKQTKIVSKELVIDDVEYYNTMPKQSKTLNGHERSEKNGEVKQHMGGTGSKIETGSHRIYTHEDSMTEFEANEYFVLERENTTVSCQKVKGKEAKNKVNREQTTPSGEKIEAASFTDKEENYYINQRSDRNSEHVKEEITNADMYFVLEKC